MSRSLKPDGPLDLEKTLECGQTFFWHRENGKYYTVRKDGVLKVWQEGDELHYENLGEDIDPLSILRLGDPLEEIYREISKDDFTEKAIEENRGLRIINDEFFPCLISFITSAQMKIDRIKEVQDELVKKFGEELEFDGKTYYQFPEPEGLAKVSVKELKDLGLGYRADYIKQTSWMVQNEEVYPQKVKEMDREEARKELMKLPGVGDKVADCVLLFSLDFLEAFPIDTWMWKVVESKYPDFYSSSYSKTSEQMRDYFGRYAGYAHEYLFHYGRTCMDFD